MIVSRNFVRIILFLGAISAWKYVHAGELSTFGNENQIYRLKYSTTIQVKEGHEQDAYLAKAFRHSNYLVGQLAYSPRRENGSATGSPLRVKEDVKVVKIEQTEVGKMNLTYEYDGEVVLDRKGLKTFTLYLPKDYEAIETTNAETIAACSFEPDYVDQEALLSAYWTPFARYCQIPYQTVYGTLTIVPQKITYPDYPRLAKDGVISVALLIGKMESYSSHDLYGRDESADEFRQILKRMNRLGFVRKSSTPPADLDHSYQETYELRFESVRFEVNVIFGNSVFHEGKGRAGVNDFYRHYLRLAKSSSVVIYSGHAGFMLESDWVSFHDEFPLVLEENRYQIFVMNGCQTTNYGHPYFSVKSSKDLDLFVNARETIVNASATTALLDAMVDWARRGRWASYRDLVHEMDLVGATLGVVGEHDNPTQPY